MKSRLSSLRKVQNLRDMREWLGLSLSQIACEIPKTRGKASQHVSRAFVCMIQRGERDLLPGQMTAITNLVLADLCDELKRDGLTVTITHHSPWHVRVIVSCAKCGRQFELQRATARRCNRCVARQRR